MMPPWPIRLRCWLLGHRWVVEERGEPVTIFPVCCVCGKWERR